jgi:hypothetical protein
MLFLSISIINYELNLFKSDPLLLRIFCFEPSEEGLKDKLLLYVNKYTNS